MKTPLDNALEEISKKITFFDKKYETQYGRPDEYVDKVFTKEYSFAFFDSVFCCLHKIYVFCVGFLNISRFQGFWKPNNPGILETKESRDPGNN